jgi:hypothetical protein
VSEAGLPQHSVEGQEGDCPESFWVTKFRHGPEHPPRQAGLPQHSGWGREGGLLQELLVIGLSRVGMKLSIPLGVAGRAVSTPSEG